MKTKELLQKKVPVERIAKRLNLSQTAVINQLEQLIDAGERLDLEYLKLPRDRFEVMKKAFTEYGDERLKPVFESLKEKFSYDELKLARLLLRQ